MPNPTRSFRRNGRQSRLEAIFSLLLTLLLPRVGFADLDYHVYDIRSMGCQPYVYAWDVNNLGEMTGTSAPAGCEVGHAFIWRNGVFEDISIYYEPYFTTGVGIGNNGRVAGFGNPDLAIVYYEQEAHPLPKPLECSWNSYPNAINRAGTIAVGDCHALDFGFHGTVYDLKNDTAVIVGWFPDSPPDTQAASEDVNNAGLVVGGMIGTTDPDYVVGFLWVEGQLTAINNTIGGTYFYPVAVNNQGYMVGTADGAFGEQFAASYDLATGEMRNLGPGGFHGVNESRVGVGVDVVNGRAHAIAYYDDQYVDLHDFMPAGFDSSTAYAVNDYGWIVVQLDDTPTNSTRGILMIPIYDKGDYDGDEDVDLHDFGHFQECFAAEPYQGPEGGLHVGCSVFDFDDDVDLDLTDYAAFQSAFTGPITSGW